MEEGKKKKRFIYKNNEIKHNLTDMGETLGYLTIYISQFSLDILVIYCCITNFHKRCSLKQYTFIIQQFL